MSAVLRPYHPSDLPAMYRICLLTGDAGGDATWRYRDPDLVGHVFVGPYPTADPALSFVVVDDEGVAGYLVGTADSTGFAAWAQEHWWPVLREVHPMVPDESVGDRWLVEWIHRPPYGEPPSGHPAHLHVDLLPRLQRQGWGRRLIGAFTAALAARGVPGLFLEADARNANALDFYAHLGFVPDEKGRLLLPADRWP